MDSYDVIVLGGGSTGEVVAGRAAAGGLKVAIVEFGAVGGECSYYACMPSKVLLRPGSERALAQAVPGLSRREQLGIDAAETFRRRDEVTHRLDDQGQVQWLRDANVELFRGEGRLRGEKLVAIRARDGSTRELQAKRAVVIATGTDPAIPDIPGLRAARPWTNRDATQARTVPKRLFVLGGGAVGCELAQAFHALGSKDVHLVERSTRLVPRFEEHASALLTECLTREGIHVLTATEMVGVERPKLGGPVTAKLGDGKSIEADELLVALGRSPRTRDIGLESVGLPAGRYVDVDDQLRAKGVPGDWLYACGDANGRNLLTHMGKYQGRIAADVILGKDIAARADDYATPQVLFTHPQIASVGLTEAQAHKRNMRVRSVTVALESVGGTAVTGVGLTGWAKLVVNTDEQTIAGATFVGMNVGESLHAATIAVTARVPLQMLWHAVPSYPTVTEIWVRLLGAYGV